MALRPVRAVLAISALFLLGLALAAQIVWVWLDAPGPLAVSRAVVIPKNVGSEGIARRLFEAGVIVDPRLFRLAAHAMGRLRPLRAGEYEFSPQASALAAIRLMQSGRTVVRRITLPEGLTVKQALTLLGQTEGLEGQVGRVPAEGRLLPETYHYSWGDSRQGIVDRMEEAMRETLARAWAGRSVSPVVKTAEEALALASIVEKETGVAAERARVAAVFLNRLMANMKLQSDPTVIYGLSRGEGGLPRALARADLEADSPFNTYTRAGLPPTPIANPGRAALEAVLNPMISDELYFVADGSGGHAFAKTLEEHNRNVARWRKIQNERGKEQNPPPSR